MNIARITTLLILKFSYYFLVNSASREYEFITILIHLLILKHLQLYTLACPFGCFRSSCARKSISFIQPWNAIVWVWLFAYELITILIYLWILKHLQIFTFACPIGCFLSSCARKFTLTAIDRAWLFENKTMSISVHLHIFHTFHEWSRWVSSYWRTWRSENTLNNLLLIMK